MVFFFPLPPRPQYVYTFRFVFPGESFCSVHTNWRYLSPVYTTTQKEKSPPKPVRLAGDPLKHPPERVFQNHTTEIKQCIPHEITQSTHLALKLH